MHSCMLLRRCESETALKRFSARANAMRASWCCPSAVSASACASSCRPFSLNARCAVSSSCRLLARSSASSFCSASLGVGVSCALIQASSPEVSMPMENLSCASSSAEFRVQRSDPSFCCSSSVSTASVTRSSSKKQFARRK
eukprot:570931-Rhodomonas_salina.1